MPSGPTQFEGILNLCGAKQLYFELFKLLHVYGTETSKSAMCESVARMWLTKTWALESSWGQHGRGFLEYLQLGWLPTFKRK